MENFTPLASLIGLSTSVMLLFNGKIAGISGIVGGILSPAGNDTQWRLVFVGGLLVGGLFVGLASSYVFAMEIERSWGALILAGLLVGFGSRFGSGCTSGPGVCGISRFSPRSLIAIVTFITTGALAVNVVKHVFGGVV